MKLFTRTAVVSALACSAIVVAVLYFVFYPMDAEDRRESSQMTDFEVSSEPNPGLSKQLAHLAEIVPELSGLSTRWEQLDGWDSFREVVPQLYDYYDSDLVDDITTTIEKFNQLPWQPQTATIQGISQDLIAHFYFVHRIKSFADAKREINTATLLELPEFDGTEFYTSCMDAAEVNHRENTVATFAFIAHEMKRTCQRYSKYHAEGVEYALSSDLSLELATIGTSIRNKLIAEQQEFRHAWQECNDEYRKKYHPILEEQLLTYVKDLADFLDYAIEKSENFEVGKKHQALDADEFEQFRLERVNL